MKGDGHEKNTFELLHKLTGAALAQGRYEGREEARQEARQEATRQATQEGRLTKWEQTNKTQQQDRKGMRNYSKLMKLMQQKV